MDYSDLVYVTSDVPERAYAQKGDILICARNGSRALVGKSAIIDKDGMAFGAFMAIFRSICNPYIQLFINSYVFRGQLEGATTTTINQITQDMLKRQLCPLPPLAEQARIVAKYNELAPMLVEYAKAYSANDVLEKAFPEQLKKSILQWAVQGKLVPQDENDEPAEVLLERIRAEKEALIKSGKIKRDKHESVIFRRDNSHYEKLGEIEHCIDEEIPYEIPETWQWCRFSTVIELQSGQDLTPDKYNAIRKGIPYLTGASNIQDSTVIINRWTEHPRSLAHKGEILLTCKGTVGTMAILQENEVHIARQIMSVKPTKFVSTQYVQLVLNTLIEVLKAVAKSMIPGISREDVLTSLIPLPPLAEQQRIVAKIEELMPLVKTV